MKKRQMTFDEFEEELKREPKKEEAPKTLEKEKVRRPYKDNIPKDYGGAVNYNFHDDWWSIVLDDGTEIGYFTSKKSAMNWAKMFIGREE